MSDVCKVKIKDEFHHHKKYSYYFNYASENNKRETKAYFKINLSRF